MLALTRSKGESLIIGDVTVKINRVIGARVQLGIVAPKSIPVLRLEIMEDGRGGLGQTPLQAMAKAAKLIREGRAEEAGKLLESFATLDNTKPATTR